MEVVVWDVSLSVGVRQFDDEHKQLVNYINQLNQALKIGGTDKNMEGILNGLVGYTKIHFKHEEDHMVLYDYPEFRSHKKEHDDLTAQVVDFQERFKSGGVKFSLELMIFLRDWLIKHIQNTDMRYKKFFSAKGIQ